MIEEIKIEAYKVKCDWCDDCLIISVKEIHQNLGDEINSVGWLIKDGKHYCGECQDRRLNNVK